MGSNVKITSGHQEEAAEELRQIHNVILGSPFHQDNIEKTLNNIYKPALVEGITSVFNFRSYAKRLIIIQNTLDTIANMCIAITSAIYAYRVKPDTKAEALNFLNIKHEQSPFRNQLLIDVFTGKNKKSLINEIVESLEKGNAQVVAGSSGDNDDVVQELQQIVINTDQTLSAIEFIRTKIDSLSIDPKKVSSDIVSGLGSYITQESSKVIQRLDSINLPNIERNLTDIANASNSTQTPANLKYVITNAITDAFKNSKIKQHLKVDIKGKGLEALQNVIETWVKSKEFKSGGSEDLLKSLFELIFHIAEFDTKKYKQAVRNLKKFAKLFAKSNIFSKLGLSSRGILRGIIENVQDILKETKDTANTAKSVATVFSVVDNIMNIDEDQLDRLIDNTKDLNELIRTDFRQVVLGIKNVGKLIKSEDFKNVNKNVEEIRRVINTIVNGVPERDKIKESKKSLNEFDKFLEEFKQTIKNLKFDKRHINSAVDSNKGLQLIFDSYTSIFRGINKSLIYGPIAFSLMNSGITNAKKLIKNIVDHLDSKSIKKSQKTLKELIPLIETYNTMSSKLVKLFGKLALMALLAPIGNIGTRLMMSTMKQLEEFVDKTKKLKITKSFGESLEALSKGIRQYSRALNKVGRLGLFGKFAERGFDLMILSIDKLEEFNKKLKKAKLNKSNLDKLDILTKVVRKASGAILLAGLAGTLAIPLIPGLLIFPWIIGTFIKKLCGALKHAGKDIKKADKQVNLIISFIWKTSLIMVAGAAVMMIPGLLEGAFKFILTLSLFIVGVLGALALGAIMMKRKTINNALTLAKMVFILGLTLCIGSAFMLIPGAAIGALMFTVTLSLFVLGVITAVGLARKVMGRHAIKDAIKLGYMISILAAVMMIGSLFMMIPGAVIGALLFTVTLSLFLLGILVSVGLAKLLMGARTIRDAIKLGRMVAMLAGIMMIGALFMYIPGIVEQVLKFTGLLVLFLLGVLLTVGLAKLIMGKRVIRDAIQLGVMISILAGIMLIGAAMMFIPKMAENALLFVGLMALFILATVGILGLIARFLAGRKIIGIMWSFAGIILLLSAILIGAAYLMMKNPQMTEMMIIYVITSLIFVGGMALIFGILASKFKDPRKIYGALLALIAIGISAILIGFAMKKIGEAYAIVNTFGTVKEFWQFLAQTGVVLVVAAGAVIGLGMIWTTEKGKELLPAGALALLALIVCVGLMGKAMQEIGIGYALVKSVGSVKEFWGYLGQVGVILVAAAGAIMGLGALMWAGGGLGAAIYAAGAAALAALAADIILVGRAIQEIAKAIKSMQEVKNVDTKEIKQMISSCADLVMAFKPFAKKDVVKTIKTASEAIKHMGIAISSIAEGVQEYASLKVPIYTGTKKTGYRQLTPKDFSEAAVNIKKIILTVGGAIIQTYKEAPKGMFDAGFLGMGSSPFEKVVKQTSKLGQLISKIAEGVQDYANLKMPVYEEGSTKIKTYVKLQNSDFKAAAENIKEIILTLGKGVIKAYTDAPKGMFDSEFLGMGSSPFQKVIKQTSKLGKLISEICKGVQDYANLKVPIYSDKSDKVQGYRNLNTSDFEAASNNIVTVITLLGKAIEKAYVVNPNMFWGGKNSVFSKVVDSTSKLGGLISDISKGLQNYVNLKMPVYKKNSTEIQSYQNLDKNDFENASNNIELVISTLGKAIIKAYDSNPEIFEAGFLRSESRFSKVVKSISGLGDLIFKIAHGIQLYSTLRVPEYEGTKIKSYRQLDPKDFVDASNNIKKVITTLGQAIMETYTQSPQLFYGDAEDNQFHKIVKSCQLLGNLVSNLAIGVKNYATLAIPEYEGTKIVSYRNLDSKDFNTAAKNISKIVSTIGGAILDIYSENPNIFKDPDDKGTIFNQVSVSVAKMSDMINKIGASVRGIASLKILKWEGLQVTGYETLETKDFDNAADNVKNIITTIGGAIVELYEQKPEIFKASDGGSIFDKMMGSFNKMSKMIALLGKSIRNISALSIPIWEGTEFVGYEKLTKEDLDKSANNISSILTCLAGTIISIYDNNREYFDVNLKDTVLGGADGNKFSIIMKSCQDLSMMVSRIVSSIRAYSTMIIPETVDGKVTLKRLTDADFLNSAKNIGSILTALGGTIIGLYESKPEMFKDPEEGGDNPFVKVVKSTTSLSNVICKLAEGIKNFATLRVPEYKGTKIVNYRKLEKSDFETASAGVEKVITTVGRAVLETYEKHKEDLFGENTKFNEVIESFQGIGNLVGTIADSVFNFAKNKVPIYKGDKIVRYEPIKQHHYDAASNCVKSILSNLVTAIIEVYEGTTQVNGKQYYNRFLFTGDNPIFVKVTEGIGSAVELVGKVASTVYQFVSGEIATNWNSKGEAISKISMKDLDFNKVKTDINTIIKAMVTPIVEIYNQPDIKSLWTYDPEKANDKNNENPLNVISGVIQNISSVVGEVAKSVKSFAELAIPIKFDSSGKATEYVSLTSIDLSKESVWYKKISEMLALMPSLISNLLTNVSTKSLFESTNAIYNSATTERISSIYPILSNICTSAVDSAIEVADAVGRFGSRSIDKNALHTILATIPQSVANSLTLNRAGQELLPVFNIPLETLRKVPSLFNFIAENLIESISAAYESINNSKLTSVLYLTVAANTFRSIFEDQFNLPKIILNAQKVNVENKLKNEIVTTYKNIDAIVTAVSDVYINAQESLELIQDPQETINKIVTIINGLNGIDFNLANRIPEDLREKARIIKSSIEDFLTSLNNPVPTEDAVNSITWSINQIDETVSKIKDPANFAKEVKSTGEFVQTVNKIDLNKTNAMTELMKAMKESLDVQNTNRVQQLIIRLTETIDVLTNELDRTSQTMAIAEKIHAERHKRLGATVEKVRSMIDKPITVTVVSDDTEGNTETTQANSANASTLYPSSSGTPTIGPGSTGSFNPFNQNDKSAQDIQYIRDWYTGRLGTGIKDDKDKS